MPYKARIHKFIIIPICTIYKDEDIIREEKMKPSLRLSVDAEFFGTLASKLEKRINDDYIPKLNLKASESGGSRRNKRNRKSV